MTGRNMNEKDRILNRLRTMLQERFNADPNQVTEETRLSQLGVDSILMADMMIDIESDLDFTFKTLDLPKNPSVGDVVQLIHESMHPAG